MVLKFLSIESLGLSLIRSCRPFHNPQVCQGLRKMGGNIISAVVYSQRMRLAKLKYCLFQQANVRKAVCRIKKTPYAPSRIHIYNGNHCLSLWLIFYTVVVRPDPPVRIFTIKTGVPLAVRNACFPFLVCTVYNDRRQRHKIKGVASICHSWLIRQISLRRTVAVLGKRASRPRVCIIRQTRFSFSSRFLAWEKPA